MSKLTKQKLHKTHIGELTREEQNTSRRLGFMQGEITIPDDFDQMGKDGIAHLFKAATISTCGDRFNRQTEK